MKVTPAPIPESPELEKLMHLWACIRELEDYATLELRYKGTAQSTLGKMKRDLADKIADATVATHEARIAALPVVDGPVK